MFDKFKQAGEMAKMVKQANDLKKALEKEVVVVEDGDIRIEITATQKIKSFSIQGVSNDAVVKSLNKAIEESQKAAAKRMQDMGGGLQGLMKGMGM